MSELLLGMLFGAAFGGEDRVRTVTKEVPVPPRELNPQEWCGELYGIPVYDLYRRHYQYTQGKRLLENNYRCGDAKRAVEKKAMEMAYRRAPSAAGRLLVAKKAGWDIMQEGW